MPDKVTPQRRASLQSAAREAEALRKEWRDAVQHHGLRVEAQFKELARRLRVTAKGRQAKGLPSAKDAQHIRDLMAKVRVKPAKGRAKDLRHVESALRAAIDRLPP
jgi:hypothetical protein